MTSIAARPAVSAAPSARSLPRLGAVASVGAVAAALTAAGVGLDGLVAPDAWSVVRGLVVAAWIAVGAYTSWRRPASRFGLILAEIGLLFALASLSASRDPLAHSIGRVTLAVVVVYLAYAFLSFPRDRLGTRSERRLLAALAVATGALWLVALPLVEELPVGGPLVDCGAACPENAFRLVSVPEPVSSALGLAINGVTALALLAVVAVLVDKARSPARLRRRLVVPLLTGAIALTLTYAAYTLIRGLGVEDLTPVRVLGAAAVFAIPAAMLVGQVRGRVFAATSLVELVARVGREPVTAARVESLLREALGDPLLRLALRGSGPDDYVDVAGRPTTLPARRREVGVTPVLRRGKPVAALVHDATLDEGSGIAEGLAATVLMLLENAQLVEELRASRARIVESGQRERLRLERNLHDGAQQRLFGIQLKLTDARARVHDPELDRDLHELVREAAATVDELRALAQGLYPTVLRERGLADALRAAARPAAIPVRVVDRGVGRCSPTVEEAVYFCTLEAIQNAAKHAGSGATATVTLVRRGDELEFAVEDDGAGFDPSRRRAGMGTLSMRDRIGAIGGTLEVESHPGRGTVVRGFVPDGAPPVGAASEAIVPKG